MIDDPFRRLTTLRPGSGNTDERGTFDGTVDSVWTIGSKVHGGAMMALCAAAAQDLVASDAMVPLAVSATYLSAPDPGPVTLDVTVLRRGKRVAYVDTVLLGGGGVPAVRSTVTLGAPDTRAPEWSAHTPVHDLPVEPPEDAGAIADGHPMSTIVNLARACDMRLDHSSAPFLQQATGEPEIRMWVRPRPDDEADPRTASLFAIMAGDICAPITMNLGSFGWAPTVQLTTYLRRAPAPGWLRVRASGTAVGQTWFDEDHTIVDSTGAVVVQSRQMAMVPRG